MNRLSDIYYTTESYLFPVVKEEIGEIIGKMKEFLRILEIVRPSRRFCKAFDFRGQPENLIFHSDQGTQYTAYEFRKMLRDLGVKQSFSNPGCPYDNAVAESFFSIMKQEELSHNYYNSLKELEDTVSEYIEFYNTMRPHKRLKGMSPTVFEIKYFSLA